MKDNLIIDGPDDATFVFGTTFSPQSLDVWVHWYDATTELYHMNYVTSCPIKDTEGASNTRKCMYNILEWGANDRFFQQQSVRDQIGRYARWVDGETRAARRRKGNVDTSKDTDDVAEVNS